MGNWECPSAGDHVHLLSGQGTGGILGYVKCWEGRVKDTGYLKNLKKFALAAMWEHWESTVKIGERIADRVEGRVPSVGWNWIMNMKANGKCH